MFLSQTTDTPTSETPANETPASELSPSISARPRCCPSLVKGLLIVFSVVVAVGVAAVGYLTFFWEADEPAQAGALLTEQKIESNRQALSGGHPLDKALEMAYEGLTSVRQNVKDYTAVVVKRERIGGKLVEEKMFVKIRNRKKKDGTIITPFSVYLRYLEPKSKAGREVIYVEGRNDGKLIGHDTGLKNLFRVKLNPKGYWAMLGNRYPITHIGIQHMIEELVVKGERDRKRGEVTVKFTEGVKVGGRSCTLLTVTHPKPRPYFDFHVAQIFIDKDRKVPLRYAAYQWPAQNGDGPVLDEEYVYMDMKLNVGLTDRDFDPDNPEYKFP